MTTPARPSLSAFWHDLPREGKMLLSIVVIEFIGTGLVIPFSVIYLTEVRGFPLDDVGLALAVPTLAGFLVVGPGGTAIDRFGARVVLMGALVCATVSNALLAFADTLALACVALAVQGIGFGVSFPAFQSFIATLVPAHLRQRYYGVNFSLLNLGIGIGGVVGGLFVDVDRLVTFQAIFLLDAASYLPALCLLTWALRHVGGRPFHDHDDPPARESYLSIVRRPVFGLVLVLSFVGSFVGYSQLNTGAPAFARAVSEVSTRTIGFGFAVNTLVIVALQLVVLQRIEGRRRTRVIAVMGLVWVVAWLVLGTTGLLPGGVAAAVLFAAFMGVFGLGETMLQPTIPALVNDLAPDHSRGRYNAASSAAFQAAAVTGPPVAGFLIAHELDQVYVGVLVAGSLLLAALALRLERTVPPEVNGVHSPQVDTHA